MGTILCALDVAHRWQVLVVVQMLASAVSQRINMENFELITDTALRLQLTLLLATCRAFATSHAREMRQVVLVLQFLSHSLSNVDTVQCGVKVGVTADVNVDVLVPVLYRCLFLQICRFTVHGPFCEVQLTN